MKHTWTAIVSAILFVGLAALIAVVPIDFVAWSPGVTFDVLGDYRGKPAISISGLTTYPTTGQLRMTTVSVTKANSRLGLPEALFDYWMPNRDVLPRDTVYPKGQSADQINAAESEMMDMSQTNATVAALRAAGQPVTEMPMVSTVLVSGPSNGKLLPGDLIEKIDGKAVTTTAAVGTAIRAHAVGDAVVVTVLRGGKSLNLTITTVSSNQSEKLPVVGITVDTGYKYSANVTYGIDPSVMGPSAGLIFSLAIFDKITSTDWMSGRIVAGTGEISADGTVSAIGGIQEKIAGAKSSGATAFLLPAANCGDLAGVHTSMDLIKVSSLKDAISALTALKTGSTVGLQHC